MNFSDFHGQNKTLIDAETTTDGERGRLIFKHNFTEPYVVLFIVAKAGRFVFKIYWTSLCLLTRILSEIFYIELCAS